MIETLCDNLKMMIEAKGLKLRSRFQDADVIEFFKQAIKASDKKA